MCFIPTEKTGKELLKCLGMQKEGIYQARIEAVAIDSPAAMDIMTAITDTKTIINAVNARATQNGLAAVD